MSVNDLERQYVLACERNDLGLRTRLAAELQHLGAVEDARLSAPDALIKAAVWYGRRGVAVFPCAPRGKQPLGQLVPHGLKDATTDEATIVRWWRTEPTANIGAPTGHLFDVIDIDGAEGVGATYGNSIVFPPEVGHTLTTRDAGHHVFVKPSGRGNAANLFPSVDYRGAGGYVILPPSVGANGRRYRWTRPLEVSA